MKRGREMQITSVRHNWPEKPGFTISRPDGHVDYTFLHFICNVTLEINGVRQELHSGACLIYSPGAPQWYTGENGLLHNWMHISGDYGKMLREYDLQPDTVYYPSSDKFISRALAAIETEYFSDAPYRQELLEARLRELTIMLSRSVRSALPTEAPRSKREVFDTVRNMLLSSPEKAWRVSELAKEAMVSESGFYAAYKLFYGSTPMSDLIEARIRYACSLLVTTALSVYEIASTVGYTNPCHFIRQFRQITGRTPAVYRKEVTKGGMR